MARKSRKNITDRQIEILNIAQYIRTAEYVRLSVEDNDNKGNSIENQKLILDDYIAHNSDMRLVDVYIDNGATGTNFQRPEFQRMIDDIENGKIDCVIVKDLSRLGRNSIDTGFYIDRYFPEKKVRFIAVNDNFDTEALSNGDEMLLYIKNIINEAYALDIGKKIKTQARQAMRDGQYVSARPKYGYLKDPNDCHKLIVNPETAPVVRLIFELFNGGTAMNEICLQLNERQIPTPSVYGYQKGYIGSTKMVKRDESEWIKIPNHHPAIVSEELFKKANQMRRTFKQPNKQQRSYPLRSKVMCGCCKHAMDYAPKKSPVYRCGYTRNDETELCYKQEISESLLNKAVFDIISKQAEIILNIDNASNIDNAQIKIEQLADMEKQITAYQKEKQILYEQLLTGKITLR